MLFVEIPTFLAIVMHRGASAMYIVLYHAQFKSCNFIGHPGGISLMTPPIHINTSEFKLTAYTRMHDIASSRQYN